MERERECGPFCKHFGQIMLNGYDANSNQIDCLPLDVVKVGVFFFFCKKIKKCLKKKISKAMDKNGINLLITTDFKKLLFFVPLID